MHFGFPKCTPSSEWTVWIVPLVFREMNKCFGNVLHAALAARSTAVEMLSIRSLLFFIPVHRSIILYGTVCSVLLIASIQQTETLSLIVGSIHSSVQWRMKQIAYAFSIVGSWTLVDVRWWKKMEEITPNHYEIIAFFARRDCRFIDSRHRLCCRHWLADLPTNQRVKYFHK